MAKAVHYTIEQDGGTYCGAYGKTKDQVTWAKKEVTCGNCLKMLAKDKARGF